MRGKGGNGQKGGVDGDFLGGMLQVQEGRGKEPSRKKDSNNTFRQEEPSIGQEKKRKKEEEKRGENGESLIRIATPRMF